jgi:AbrB family looped-hinge helix DNA binding protein
MPVLVLDAKGRVTLPAAVRAALGLHAGDALFYAITDGELRVSPARDPYAHLSDAELMEADAAYLREHPEEVAWMQEEAALWDGTLQDGLEPEEWDAKTRLPRTR